MICPYWKAKQICERSGKLSCIDLDQRVVIGGMAKTYIAGKIGL